jgi:hypothetical protein
VEINKDQILQVNILDFIYYSKTIISTDKLLQDTALKLSLSNSSFLDRLPLSIVPPMAITDMQYPLRGV